MRRARRWTSVLLLALAATVASALEVPTDAEVLVTDMDSRIVGVGRVVGGVRFDLVLVEGFAGPALVVWLAADGGVATTAVVVADGVVWVDGDELTSLLPEAFDEVRMRVVKHLDDAGPPDVGQDPSGEVPGSGPAPGRDAPAGVDPPGPPDDAPPGDGPPHGDPPGAPESPGGRP